MFQESTSEEVSAVVEKDRPTILYRGYIPSSIDSKPVSTSNSEMLNRILSEDLNPHEQQFANGLIWATPDKGYAKQVTIMRFMVRLSTDVVYQRQIREGRAPLPSIAEYTIGPKTKIYNAEGKSLKSTGFKETKQFIIDSLDESSIKTKTLEDESVMHLLQVLDTEMSVRHFDTIARATIILDQISESDFYKDNKHTFIGQTFGEILSNAFLYYESKGLDKMRIEENLAKGLFSGSSNMGVLALQSRFVD